MRTRKAFWPSQDGIRREIPGLVGGFMMDAKVNAHGIFFYRRGSKDAWSFTSWEDVYNVSNGGVVNNPEMANALHVELHEPRILPVEDESQLVPPFVRCKKCKKAYRQFPMSGCVCGSVGFNLIGPPVEDDGA